MRSHEQVVGDLANVALGVDGILDFTALSPGRSWLSSVFVQRRRIIVSGLHIWLVLMGDDGGGMLSFVLVKGLCIVVGRRPVVDRPLMLSKLRNVVAVVRMVVWQVRSVQDCVLMEMNRLHIMLIVPLVVQLGVVAGMLTIVVLAVHKVFLAELVMANHGEVMMGVMLCLIERLEA